MKISFILVSPAVPENVGAAARALKTMGFSTLNVVNSSAHLDEKALWLAHGSGDILKSIKSYSTIEEAAKGSDLLIGTTSKQRGRIKNYICISDLAENLERKKGMIKQISIVFGSEEAGLSTNDLEKCDIVSYINLSSPFPSINLAQAVMIYAYELSVFSIKSSTYEKKKTGFDFNAIKSKIFKTAQAIGIENNSNLHKRIFERIGSIDEKNLNIIASICGKIDKKIKNG